MGVHDRRLVLGTLSHFRNVGLFGHMNLCKTCQHNLVKAFPFIRLKTHYAVLGVSPKATKSEIKAAYIRRSKQEHPDTNKSSKGSHDAFVKINEAYNVLSNENSRSEYDATLNYGSSRYSNTTNYPYGRDTTYYPYGRPPKAQDYYDASQQQYRAHYRYTEDYRRENFSHSRRSHFDDSHEEEWFQNPFASGYEKRGREKGSNKAKRTMKPEDDMRHVNRFDFIFNTLVGIMIIYAIYETLHLIFSYFYYKNKANLSNSAKSADQKRKLDPNKKHYGVSSESSPVEKSLNEDIPIEKSQVEQLPVKKSRDEKPPVKTIQLEDKPVKKISVKDTPLPKSHVDVKPVQQSHPSQSS